MASYTLEFNTPDETAILHTHADTPQLALQKARRWAVSKRRKLHFVVSRRAEPLVEEIVIYCGGEKVRRWQSDELRLRLVAPELLVAARHVLDSWTPPNLAEAVRALAAAVAEAKRGRSAPLRERRIHSHPGSWSG